MEMLPCPDIWLFVFSLNLSLLYTPFPHSSYQWGYHALHWYYLTVAKLSHALTWLILGSLHSYLEYMPTSGFTFCQLSALFWILYQIVTKTRYWII